MLIRHVGKCHPSRQIYQTNRQTIVRWEHKLDEASEPPSHPASTRQETRRGQFVATAVLCRGRREASSAVGSYRGDATRERLNHPIYQDSRTIWEASGIAGKFLAVHTSARVFAVNALKSANEIPQGLRAPRWISAACRAQVTPERVQQFQAEIGDLDYASLMQTESRPNTYVSPSGEKMVHGSCSIRVVVHRPDRDICSQRPGTLFALYEHAPFCP